MTGKTLKVPCKICKREFHPIGLGSHMAAIHGIRESDEEKRQKALASYYAKTGKEPRSEKAKSAVAAVANGSSETPEQRVRRLERGKRWRERQKHKTDEFQRAKLDTCPNFGCLFYFVV